MTERVKSDDLTRSVIWGLTFPSNVLPYLVQFLFWPGQWRLIVGRHDLQEATEDRLVLIWTASGKSGKLTNRCYVLCLRAGVAELTAAAYWMPSRCGVSPCTRLSPEATQGGAIARP